MQQSKSFISKVKTNIERVSASLTPPKKSPDELLGELFADVQLGGVHTDGKTFVDAMPVVTRRKIIKDYMAARQQPGFDLPTFVSHYFEADVNAPSNYHSNPNSTPEEHITELWSVLTRTAHSNKGSVVALPHPFIVPGGRFQEQYYWDSFFTMLGLAASDRWDLIESMMKNFTYLIRKVGHIPNGNRTYYLSRSHPPFFVEMVRLMVQRKGEKAYVRYLPALLLEYQYWMSGRTRVNAQKPAYKHVVRMPDGAVLNRYYDVKQTPRPESYREDVEIAEHAKAEQPKVYLDLRAGGESGWDFSSRWLADGKNLSTIHTSDIVPIDLNCLLLRLEETIADAYDVLLQPLLAKRYRAKAARRTAAIRKYCWNETEGFYFDYDFVAGKQTTIQSMAAAFAIYAKVATPTEAEAIAKKLEQDFLQPGGFVTTLYNTGQQWDSPNGWAPLQWIANQGLRNYGYNSLASEARKRWVDLNVHVYKETGKMVEKYDVVDITKVAGGGEYTLQDGFGWTNGVLMAFLKEAKR